MNGKAVNRNTDGRPGPVFFIFAIITILYAFSLWHIKFDSRYIHWDSGGVRFEYFGMDAGELEKLIAGPLEEGISALGNVAEIRTVCDYGLVETTAFFIPGRMFPGQGTSEKKKIYLALMDTVDSLYRELPAAVQKPRIYEAGGGRRPFFSAAILGEKGESPDQLRSYAEHNLKSELENLEGVAEMIRSMAMALIQSFAAVMIIVPFFFSSPRAILLIRFFLPVCVVWSLGLLRVLGMGIDQYTLSGLSISLGLVIDPWLVIAAQRDKVKQLSKGIDASAFTTLLVIFPLCFLDSITPGIQRTALAIITMVANSPVP